jgi:hypothetical protein
LHRKEGVIGFSSNPYKNKRQNEQSDADADSCRFDFDHDRLVSVADFVVGCTALMSTVSACTSARALSRLISFLSLSRLYRFRPISFSLPLCSITVSLCGAHAVGMN